jgi:hypothetical protein
LDRKARGVGIIRADSREKRDATEANKAFFAIVDEGGPGSGLLLDYPSPDGRTYSYDCEIVTKAGQAVRCEIKWSWADLYGSWMDRESEDHSRLWRQTRHVDLLLVVWDDFAVEMQARPQQLPALKGLRNRLARMVLECDPPVLIVGSVQQAIEALCYLRDIKEPLRLGRRPLAESEEASASELGGSA